MGKEEETFKQIGLTLAKHFDSVYYVDIESGRYEEFVHMKQLEDLRIPNRGEDFFEDSVENAASCVHPDDMEAYCKAVDSVLCENPEMHPFLYRARRPDGAYVILTARGFVLSDPNGEPEYFGGIIVPE